MRKIVFSIFILFFINKYAWADIHNAATCSRTDVGSAISAASPGDTVTVPAGNCTWTTPLTITKGITLQGAGVGQTLITANLGYPSVLYYDTRRHATPYMDLITYKPSDPVANEAFRLTGFEIDAQGVSLTSGNYVLLVWGTGTYPLTNIRIDHNKFKNLFYPGDVVSKGYDIEFLHARGVVDHNTFTGYPGIHVFGSISLSPWGKANWQNETFTPGSSNSLFIENNTFTFGGAKQGSVLTGSNAGGRYVFRYNTIVYPSGSSSTSERAMDAHGNSSNGYGTMGAEFYGNKFSGPSSIAFHWGVWRGGVILAFYNQATGMGNGTAHHIWEEFCDNLLTPSTATDGQPLHISNSYFWNNRAGTTLNNPSYQSYLGCETYTPAHNEAFWNHDTSFNGTSGMGCGTLAARPSTCTTGVGYWATNQSCSSIPTGSIGRDAGTPISGTLYRCASTNNWQAYYTPYTYPHPLAQADGRIPNPPMVLNVQ